MTVTVQDVVRLREAVVASAAGAPAAPPLPSPLDLLTLSLAPFGGAPDPWQETVVSSPADRMILVAARQSGKSQALAARVLSAAAGMPGTTSILISASERQAAELLSKLTAALVWLGPAGAGAVATASQIKLGNGSRVITLASTSNAVRGYTCTRWDSATCTGGILALDECAFIDQRTVDAVFPLVVANRGAIMLTTTADAVGSWAYDIHTNEGAFPQWERHTVTAWDIGRYDRAYLASEKARLTAERFGAEYECRWRVGSGSSVFEAAHLQRSFTDAAPAAAPAPVASFKIRRRVAV